MGCQGETISQGTRTDSGGAYAGVVAALKCGEDVGVVAGEAAQEIFLIVSSTTCFILSIGKVFRSTWLNILRLPLGDFHLCLPD